MIEKIKRIDNPLTIIAIFAALVEINATISMGLISPDLHHIFIWFIIGFPTLLIALFFVTLNFNTKVMYSPSDFKDDKSFMDNLHGNYYGDGTDFSISEPSIDTQKIAETVQEKFDDLAKELKNPDLKKDITSLKKQISNLTNQSISADIREVLLSFSKFPAFYTLIYAIVRSKAKSVEKLRSFEHKFYISGPEAWEGSGIPKLLEKEVLIGDELKFELNPKYKKYLTSWVSQNGGKIKAMSEASRLEENKETADGKVHKERIDELSNRLRFN